MKYSLRRIQKTFPQVKHVRDARRTIAVNVSTEDNKKGRRKDPAGCAMARACVRQKIADGAIIGLTYSWLIKGDTATRFHTSTGVSREITSFDRHHDFASGRNYKLSKVSPSNRMGTRKNWHNRDVRKGQPYREPKQKTHRTIRIRTIK